MHRLVIALVTLIGLTGAGVVAAYLFLFAAGSDRAAALAPADTAVYVNVYLQPSAGQQMNLAELIGRFPGFADDASLDDKVDQVVQNLLSGAGVDYRADVKPWLGDQVALAVAPGGGQLADADPVIIAEVTDREAAEASVADLASPDGGSFTTETHEGVAIQVGEETSYAFVDEMLVAAPDPASIRAVIDVSQGAPALAAQDDFRTTMERMPADHLAVIFVDVAAIAAEADAEQQLDQVESAGAVLVAEPDGLRLSGSAPFVEADGATSPSPRSALGGGPSTLTEWMPEGTIAEVVVFGLRQTLEDAEAAAAGTPEGEELTGMLDTVRALAAFGLGIDLDADVLPLLDREVAVALSGFDGELPSGQILLRPDDPVAAEASLAGITERLAAIGAQTTTEEVGSVTLTVLTVPDAGEVAYAVSDGTVVIGLGRDDVLASLEARDSATSLAASDAYRRTFEIAGTRAGTEAWLDVAAVVDLLGPAELEGDARDILEQIGAFGLTVPSRDDQIEFHAVLTVEETQPE